MLRRSQGRNRSIQDQINLAQETGGESSRWNFLLVIFMRCMSVLTSDLMANVCCATCRTSTLGSDITGAGLTDSAARAS